MIDLALQQQVADAFALVDYQTGGRGPDLYDCYGLIIEARRRLSLSVPVDPMRGAHGARAVQDIARQTYRAGQWQTVKACAGSIIFYPGLTDRLPVHVGIWLLGGCLDISARFGVRFRSASELSGLKWEACEWRG